MIARVVAVLVVVGVFLGAACTTGSSRVVLLQSCETYAAALTTAAAASARGKLDDRDVRSIEEIRRIVNPICSQPPASEDTAGMALGTVQGGLERLIFLNGKTGEAS
jgi:hypothetical protein